LAQVLQMLVRNICFVPGRFGVIKKAAQGNRSTRVKENPLDVNIQQINLGYDGLEDRLKLRIGLADNTEVCVWLTRKMVKILWSMLQSAQLAPLMSPDDFTPETQPLLEEIARTVEPLAPRKMDFSDTYQAGRTPRTPHPILPSDCRLVSLEQGKRFRLELEAKNFYTVRIPLTPEITQALVNMLQMTTKEAGWDLPLVSGHIIMGETTSRPVLH
jgi:hypothetical protein